MVLYWPWTILFLFLKSDRTFLNYSKYIQIVMHLLKLSLSSFHRNISIDLTTLLFVISLIWLCLALPCFPFSILWRFSGISSIIGKLAILKILILIYFFPLHSLFCYSFVLFYLEFIFILFCYILLQKLHCCLFIHFTL